MSVKKVVFLDIDGVVATDEAYYEVYKNYYGLDYDYINSTTSNIEYMNREIIRMFDTSPLAKPHVSKKYWPFSQSAIDNVHSLYNQTKCSFVMSSDWRIGRDVEEINKLMALKRLYVPFLDRTEYLEGYRGLEIRDWIHKHDVDKYVVLDDNCFDGFKESFGERFIQTNPYYGFSKEDLENAVRLLK
jgi:hypothetical protein